MPIPPFIVELRARLGNHPLPLPGVTAVVLNDAGQVLLVRRADNGTWTHVTGCLDPGEQPAVGAVREVQEETAIRARAERLISVSALPLTVWPNGDQAYFLDVAFLCRAVDGEARVNDDESVDVGWFDLDDLPELPARQRTCLRDALDGNPAARFEVA